MSLGNMSALFAVVVPLATLLLPLVGYAALATYTARRPARRYLSRMATGIAAAAVAGILGTGFLTDHQGGFTLRDIEAYGVAGCLLVIPVVIVTTGLATQYASAGSPPLESWVRTLAVAAVVLMVCFCLALAALASIGGIVM